MANNSNTFTQITFDEFKAKTPAERAAYIKKAQAWFAGLEGEKMFLDFDKIRWQQMLGQMTSEEYAQRVFKAGPACYQFTDLNRLTF